jgi:hypothetical protein
VLADLEEQEVLVESPLEQAEDQVQVVMEESLVL